MPVSLHKLKSFVDMRLLLCARQLFEGFLRHHFLATPFSHSLVRIIARNGWVPL